MRIPKEFERTLYNKNQENYSMVLEILKNSWEFDIVLNPHCGSTTLSSWEYEIDHEKSHIYPEIEYISFEGILCFNKKFNSLIIFMFEKELNSSDIIIKIRDGLYELFYKRKSKTLFNQIRLEEINKQLTEINIFFEEIDGIEYLKFLNDFESSKNINIYKIIKPSTNNFYLDEIKLKIKSVKFHDQKYDVNYYLNLFKDPENITGLYEFITKAIKTNLPGEISMRIKFDLLEIDNFLKYLAEKEVDIIRIKNTPLHLLKKPEEYMDNQKAHFVNLNDNNLNLSWMSGEINETSLADLISLLNTIEHKYLTNQTLNLHQFLLLEIKINSGVNNFFKCNEHTIYNDEVEINLKIKEKYIAIAYQGRTIEIAKNTNYSEIESLILTEIISQTYKYTLNNIQISNEEESNFPF